MSRGCDDNRSSPEFEQAADWLVRRDSGRLSAEERTAFTAWLAADPKHRAAYAEAERIWADLDRIPAGHPLRLRSAATDRAPAAAKPVAVPPAARRLRPGWPAAIAIAAGLLLAVGGGTELRIALQADATAATGEVKSVALPDGSTVVLNTASAIAIAYSPDERRLRLLRGEIEITVAADPARPFRVEAAEGISTARGTAFVVRRQEDGAVVTVLESRVSVSHRDRSGAVREATLAPDQQVVYAAAAGLGAVRTVDAQAVSAWRHGKLHFVDQPLGVVVAELNRYHFGMIRIVDDTLAAKRVNGVFETRDPMGAVAALERSLGVRSTRLGDLLILLHR